MKNLLLVTTLLLSTAVFAETFTTETVEITSHKSLFAGGTEAGIHGSAMSGSDIAPPNSNTNTAPSTTFGERVETGGKVIQVGRDMVALGEAMYDLVKKGKPSNTTEYAPISVVPKDPSTKEYVDPFELENFSMPMEKNFQTRITNSIDQECVVFNYKVVYSYGGSYNGAGKYLTSVMVVPSSVKTNFGWDFNAVMKLGGVMNNGTKADPIAGIIVNIKYQMNSWTTSFEKTDSIYINGKGELKNMNK